MNLTGKIVTSHRDTTVSSRFSSLLSADSALFTSSTLFTPSSFPAQRLFQEPPAISKFLSVATGANSAGVLEAVSVPYPANLPLQAASAATPIFFRVEVAGN